MRKLAAQQRSIYLGTFWRRSFRAAPLANRTRTRGWRWHRRRAHWSCGPAQAESPPRRAGRCCHAPQSERAPRNPNLVWSAKREMFPRVVTGLHKNANLAADNPTCDITTTPRPLVTKPRPDRPDIGCSSLQLFLFFSHSKGSGRAGCAIFFLVTCRAIPARRGHARYRSATDEETSLRALLRWRQRRRGCSGMALAR